MIKKRLAACCNIFPIESIYRWFSFAKATKNKKEKIVQDKEIVLIVKTLEKNFKEIEKKVKKLHSYTVPCILEIPIKRGNTDYLNWLKREII